MRKCFKFSKRISFSSTWGYLGSLKYVTCYSCQKFVLLSRGVALYCGNHEQVNRSLLDPCFCSIGLMFALHMAHNGWKQLIIPNQTPKHTRRFLLTEQSEIYISDFMLKIVSNWLQPTSYYNDILSVSLTHTILQNYCFKPNALLHTVFFYKRPGLLQVITLQIRHTWPPSQVCSEGPWLVQIRSVTGGGLNSGGAGETSASHQNQKYWAPINGCHCRMKVAIYTRH